MCLVISGASRKGRKEKEPGRGQKMQTKSNEDKDAAEDRWWWWWC